MKNLLFIPHSVLIVFLLKACGPNSQESTNNSNDSINIHSNDSMKVIDSARPSDMIEMPSEDLKPQGVIKSEKSVPPTFEAPKHNAPGQDKIDSIKRAGKKE